MEATFSFDFKVVYLTENLAYDFESWPSKLIYQFINNICNNWLRVGQTDLHNH